MKKTSTALLFLCLSGALSAYASVAPLPPPGVPQKLTVIQYVPTSSHDEADLGGVLPSQPVTVVTAAKGSLALGLLVPLGALVNRGNIADQNAKSAAAVQVTVIDGLLPERVKGAFAKHLQAAEAPQLAPMDTAVPDGLKIEPYVHTQVDEQKNIYAILVEYASLWQGGKQLWSTRYEYHFPDVYAADLFTSQASPDHGKFNAALDDGMDRLAALMVSELKGDNPANAPRKAAAFSPTWGDMDMGFKGELLADDGQWLVWRSNTVESMPGYGIHIFRKDTVKIH